MKCETAILLVEKLADGEASADEKALAEQHVSSCTDCRSHYTFVKALASASEKIALPLAPPQAYWEHLPSRIIARLHEDESPGIWQQLFAPSMLRWGALAATLTVVVVVGMKVSRDDLAVEAPAPQDFFQGDEIDIIEELETPEEEAAAPPAAVSTPARETAPGALLRRQESEDIRSNESEPEMLRQRIARAPARTKIEAADALGSGSRAEPKATSETSGVESPARIELAEAANVEPMRSLVLGEMQGDPAELAYPKLRPGNAGRRSFTATVEDCDTWRAYLESYPDGSRASDARYELARCTLGRYEAEPSDAGRELALRDTDAFLGDEPEGPRAEEMRARAAPLRRP